MSQQESFRRQEQSQHGKQQLFENRLYSKKELAHILRVALRTIDAMMHREELEFHKLGRAVRFNGNYLNSKFGG